MMTLTFDVPPCNYCKGPKALLHIFNEQPFDLPQGSKHSVLVRCTSKKCSWNDCTMQLELSAVTPSLFSMVTEDTSVSLFDIGEVSTPSLFDLA
jgi:hypothetical protein